jgi:hypothetical protein
VRHTYVVIPVPLASSVARRLAVVAVVALLGAPVPEAARAAVIHGATELGSSVELRPGGRLTVDWRATCPRANRYELGAVFASVPRRLGRRPVVLRGRPFRRAPSRGQPTQVRLTVSRLSRTTWAGTISVDARTVTAHGVTERCRQARVRWQVTRARGVFTIEGSAEGPVTAAPRYRYTHREARLALYTDGHTLGFAALPRRGASFVGAVEAAAGRRLRVGRVTGAERHPFNGRHPGIDLSGPGDACSNVWGEFTVHRLRFDRRGHVRAARISLVYECGYPTPVRAWLTWVRG